MALLAGIVTMAVSFFYRIRTHREFPEGPTVLVGLGAVGLVLNTRLVLIQYVGGGDPLTPVEAGLTVVVLVAAVAASYAGRRAGERLGTSRLVTSGRLQPAVSPLVRAIGRFITVELPEEFRDIDGYDPVGEQTKTTLAGRQFDFPRGMTVAELETQLSTRLRDEYNIGYVDVELTEEGTIEYLAVGQRAAGLGPTLPPNAAAVAVRADPPFSATPGDTILLWRVDDGAESRVGTAELRASVGDITTVVTDKKTARSVDPTAEYRLMTLAAEAHPEREFAALLRRQDETTGVIELTAESPLVGSPAGALVPTLIAVRPAGSDIETIPARDRLLQAGDELFFIGRPDELRKLTTSQHTSSRVVSVEPAPVDWDIETPTVESPPDVTTTADTPDADETPPRDNDSTR